MEVFSDKFGRKIWFNVSDNVLQIDLQDINEHSEYERSATVVGISELCRILKCDASNLENTLFEQFGNKTNSFDLLCDFLTEKDIRFGYYSGMR